MATSVEILWHGLILELCSEKAIYLPDSKALLVADTHFGKAATFRQAGIPVPESSSRDDCIRIEKLIERTNAQSLVFLGDFLHARAGRTDSVRAELFDWRQRVSRIDLHLVRGNHDLQSGDPWPELEIQCHQDPWKQYGFEFRHLPVERSTDPYFAGHLHPGFALKAKGRGSLRSPCFQVGENRIILPAFGTFTGLSIVKTERDDRVFMTNGKEVIEVPAS